MNEFQVRDYKDSDSNRCRDIHDLARPIELQGSCDPRAFVPLANDAKDLAEFQRAKKYVAHDEETIVGFIGVDEGGEPSACPRAMAATTAVPRAT